MPALQPPPRSRAILGHVCNLLGVVLFFTGLHFSGEPAVTLSTTQKNVISGVSLFGGGVLTLGVGRRLLRHEEVQETSSPPDSRKIG